MEQKKNNLKLVWGVIIVFIYLIIAFIFVFAPNSIFKENTLWVRVAMGILLFLYGLFRGYRLWRDMK